MKFSCKKFLAAGAAFLLMFIGNGIFAADGWRNWNNATCQQVLDFADRLVVDYGELPDEEDVFDITTKDPFKLAMAEFGLKVTTKLTKRPVRIDKLECNFAKNEQDRYRMLGDAFFTDVFNSALNSTKVNGMRLNAQEKSKVKARVKRIREIWLENISKRLN